MARKPRSFYEPWTPTKSTHHGKNPFPEGASREGYPEGVPDTILDHWFRIDRDAPWIIWGSRMASPAICKNLDGGVAVTDESRIITITRKLGLGDDAPSQEQLAKRIAACVNACAGIADPERFVADVRAMTLSYVNGECEDPRSDSRMVSILGRCIPAEELEKYSTNEDGEL